MEEAKDGSEIFNHGRNGNYGNGTRWFVLFSVSSVSSVVEPLLVARLCCSGYYEYSVVPSESGLSCANRSTSNRGLTLSSSEMRTFWANVRVILCLVIPDSFPLIDALPMDLEEAHE